MFFCQLLLVLHKRSQLVEAAKHKCKVVTFFKASVFRLVDFALPTQHDGVAE
jgi:hypothetical protein